MLHEVRRRLTRQARDLGSCYIVYGIFDFAQFDGVCVWSVAFSVGSSATAGDA